MDLQHEFSDIDIYLFDQLLKGRIGSRDRVLDAGCGSGRNLTYLLRSERRFAVDRNPHAIAESGSSPPARPISRLKFRVSHRPVGFGARLRS
jgi:SAM-dependent methyltransferase